MIGRAVDLGLQFAKDALAEYSPLMDLTDALGQIHESRSQCGSFQNRGRLTLIQTLEMALPFAVNMTLIMRRRT